MSPGVQEKPWNNCKAKGLEKDLRRLTVSFTLKSEALCTASITVKGFPCTIVHKQPYYVSGGFSKYMPLQNHPWHTGCIAGLINPAQIDISKISLAEQLMNEHIT